MSAKIEIDELQNLLIQAGVDQKTRSTIVKEAEELAAEKKAEKSENKEPKKKNEFVVIIRGDDEVEKAVQSAFVLQVPEGTADSTVIDRMLKAAKNQNNSAKRKKTFLSTWRDFFSFSKRKFTKEVDIQIKSKNAVPVYVLKTENI
jgi:hypothetical protein